MGKRKKVVKSATKRKTSLKSVAKTKQAIDRFNESGAAERCKKWIQVQRELVNECAVGDEGVSGLTNLPDIPSPSQHEINYTVDEVLEDKTDSPTMHSKPVTSESDHPHVSEKSKKTNWTKCKKNVIFPCEWKHCNEETSHKDEFANHVTGHASEIIPNEDLYECLWDLCGFITTQFSALTRHLNFHAYHTILKSYGDSVRQSVQIPRCAYDSSNRNFFADSESDYQCDWVNCGTQFNEILKFFDHVKSHCSTFFKDKKQICRWSGCNKEFRNYSLMLLHITVHTKENEIACPHCGVMYRQNYRLFDHCKKQTVPETSDFQCDICGKNFAIRRYLQDHKAKHKRDIKCTMCSMTFYTNYGYTEHVRYRHMTEKPFKCTLCPYSGVRKKDLDVHMQTHLTTTYECEEFGCNFTCTRSYMLKNHDLLVHGNGYGTFECHICDRQYKRGSYLSKHLKTKHKLNYPPGFTRFAYRQFEDGLFRLKTNPLDDDCSPALLHKGDQSQPTPTTAVTTKPMSTTLTTTSKLWHKPKKMDVDGERRQNKKENSMIIPPDNFDEDEENIDSDDLQSELADDNYDDDDDDEHDTDIDVEDCEVEDLKLEISVDEENYGEAMTSNENVIAKITADSDNCTIKNIDNFKVMKYLKSMPTKKIEIDVQSINVDGEIKSEKLEVDEIVI